MFRRRSAGTLRTLSHTERLNTLGAMLDEQQFILDGLSILASGEGFIVVGYVATKYGFQTKLVETTLEITKPMLERALARR
jgi:hypothetical protein